VDRRAHTLQSAPVQQQLPARAVLGGRQGRRACSMSPARLRLGKGTCGLKQRAACRRDRGGERCMRQVEPAARAAGAEAAAHHAAMPGRHLGADVVVQDRLAHRPVLQGAEGAACEALRTPLPLLSCSCCWPLLAPAGLLASAGVCWQAGLLASAGMLLRSSDCWGEQRTGMARGCSPSCAGASTCGCTCMPELAPAAPSPPPPSACSPWQAPASLTAVRWAPPTLRPFCSCDSSASLLASSASLLASSRSRGFMSRVAPTSAGGACGGSRGRQRPRLWLSARRQRAGGMQGGQQHAPRTSSWDLSPPQAPSQLRPLLGATSTCCRSTSTVTLGVGPLLPPLKGFAVKALPHPPEAIALPKPRLLPGGYY
jgi:hypothetical protein